MSTYATVEEVRSLVGSETLPLLPADDGDLEALIDRAELDVDAVLSARIERDPVTGRKLRLQDLSAVQVAALSRATSAALEWRILQGEEGLAEGDDGLKAVGPLTFGTPPRPPADAMLEQLAGHGFPWRSGTVGTPPEDAPPTT